MDSGALGLVIFVVVGIAAFVASRVLLAKKALPSSPPLGPMPAGDITKYYAAREPIVAWEKVRGWNVNERPTSLDAPPRYDHVVLGSRLLEFCSGSSGKLVRVFNFLVSAIENVEFAPQALPPGLAAPGFGLVTIDTPSGRTLIVGSAAFAQSLQQAVQRAR